MTNQPTCSCNKSRDYDELRERYQQLAEVAREMLTYIGSYTFVADHVYKDRRVATENAVRFCGWKEKLEELGVAL